MFPAGLVTEEVISGKNFLKSFAPGGLFGMGWWDGMSLIPSVGGSGMGDVQIIWSKVGVKGRVGIADVGAMDMFVWPILVTFELSSVLLDGCGGGGRCLIASRRSCSGVDIIFV